MQVVLSSTTALPTWKNAKTVGLLITSGTETPCKLAQKSTIREAWFGGSHFALSCHGL